MSDFEIALLSAGKASGSTVTGILSTSKRSHLVDGRRFVALLLKSDGYSDGAISHLLGRSRASVLHLRRTGLDFLNMSSSFRDQYQKCKDLYEKQKSLRVSQD